MSLYRKIFADYDELKAFLVPITKTEAVITEQTPLISNLSIIENIALIPEVHQRLSITNAEEVAQNKLNQLGFNDIAQNRIHECDELAIFATLLIRAEMMQVKQIFICRPFQHFPHLQSLEPLLNLIYTLNSGKSIVLLDLVNNKQHYQDIPCLIEQ